jgi:protein-disulfide isomerase
VKRILLVTLVLVAAAAVLVLVPRSRAQVQVTLEPSMTKGAADSRVTIVEFSDYQ